MTDKQIEQAMDFFKQIIDAAENSNHAGERAIWKAYIHLNPSKAANARPKAARGEL